MRAHAMHIHIHTDSESHSAAYEERREIQLGS